MPKGKPGVARGPRIPVSWGSAKITVKGRSTTVPLVSFMQEHVFMKTGLKAYKMGSGLKVNKDKKGREYLAGQGVSRSTSKYVLGWAGEWNKGGGKVWHKITVHPRVSLTLAAKRIQAARGKFVEVKLPSTMVGRQARLQSAEIANKKKPNRKK